ncbi:hypothetical protein CP533_5399 [Ophiocordyceps camponoti-saundersi (nom. inval.)]|nr:hypothetical protein CP533_5399 [Ophiocordyceps camponoti-saundersi (nom. inval.)]
MRKFSNIYFICSIAALGGMLFGFDISSMSGVIGTQAYKRFFNHPASYTQGAITASMPGGSLAGSLASAVLADRISRKGSLQMACLLWMTGSLVQCASQNVPMLCVGRALAGLCVGIASSVVPVYQSEMAPKEIRGRVVSLYQWAITWGILIQFFIQYGVAESIGEGPDDARQPTSAFRIPWAVQVVPALLLFVGLFFCPNSPRWLASRDRWHEALVVLADLHGGGDRRHRSVRAQYLEIETTLRYDRETHGTGYRALFRGKVVRRVMLGMGIQAWSQLCGMNIMMYYIVYVMESAEIGSPLLTASIQYIINVVLTLPAILYLDRWGRRPALIVGSLLMMTWLMASGAVQHRYGQPNQGNTRTRQNKAISWIVVKNRPASCAIVACSYLFVATFATTWGPTSWTYPAEIFPVHVRAKAVSLTTATNWLFNTVLAFAVPPLFNAVSCLHMFLEARETKGFTLEEMDQVFQSGWAIGRWRTGQPPRSGRRLEEIEMRLEEAEATIKAPGTPFVRQLSMR